MKHILILDDDISTVRLLSRFLQEANFEITATTDAHEAVDIIRDGALDLIISDVLMPKIDGFGIVEFVRSDTSTSHIPLLFISSSADERNIRKAMNMGVDDYLVKPIARELLLETIDARMTRKMQYEHQYQLALQRLRYNLTHVLPHELRTPLSGIIGVTSLLSSSVDELERSEIKEVVDSMNTSVIRLAKIIEDMLLYSRLELLLQDDASLVWERSRRTENAATVIADVARATAEHRARQNTLVVKNHLSDVDKHRALAIAQQYLHSIVGQLIDNACKYSPEESTIECVIARTGSVVSLHITDEGRGMSSEQIQAVEAFVQFEREYYEQQGIGLGLALVKKILVLVGGSMHVHSTPGVGATVSVFLPLAEEKEMLLEG